ncbi:MAG: hypothetical protein AYL32_007430 [Candidatus Bathyarchaeota archaeon B26-2]|nr:MAG: hypothetical protein AYL32_007430 [Candidatus Bathyarchaeota archaeon B26-2]
MLPFIDLHIHTRHSDGRNMVRDVVRHAEANGVEAIAITDHYHMIGYERTANYIFEIRESSEEASSTRVLVGLEVHPSGNAIPQLLDHVKKNLDIILFDPVDADPSLLSVLDRESLFEHFARVYREASTVPWIDVIAHPFCLGRFSGVKHFSDIEDWLIEEFIEASVNGEKYIEVMNEMIWWFPNSPVRRFTKEYIEFVKRAVKMGAKFSIGSDAHCSQGVGNIMWSRMVLERAGAGAENVINIEDLSR